MKTIKFCFTSEKAREIYNGKSPQYETPFASGFDLRAVGFDHSMVKDYFIEAPEPNPTQRHIMDFIFQQVHRNVIIPYNKIINDIGTFNLCSMARILVKTGIRVAMPIMENEIMELQIRSRSGLALKHGICVLNGIGTIDNDYTGELGVILHNTGHKPFEINLGDRIAQGIFNPLQQCIWQEVSQEEFEVTCCNTKRGSGGFGSTGK